MFKSQQKKYSLYWKIVTSFSSVAVLFFVINAYRDYVEVYKKATTDSESLALIFGQYTQTTIEKLDLLLKHSQDVFSYVDPSKLSAQKLSTKLAEIKKDVLDSEILTVTDELGNELGNNLWVHDQGKSFKYEKVSIGDRPQFEQQKNESADIFVISKPLVSRTTGNLIISVNGKLPKRNGKFSGVVAITINLKIFSDLFSRIRQRQISDKSVIALYTYDKVLLSRSPFDKDQIGKHFPGALPVMEKIKQGELFGNYTKIAAVDNIERIYSFRSIPSLSLILVVGKDKKNLFWGGSEEKVLQLFYYYS
jgi:hypothetical protein